MFLAKCTHYISYGENDYYYVDGKHFILLLTELAEYISLSHTNSHNKYLFPFCRVCTQHTDNAYFLLDIECSEEIQVSLVQNTVQFSIQIGRLVGKKKTYMSLYSLRFFFLKLFKKTNVRVNRKNSIWHVCRWLVCVVGSIMNGSIDRRDVQERKFLSLFYINK